MPLTALPKILNQNLKKGIDKPGAPWYNDYSKTKEENKMKKIYEITISFCGKESTITLVNPHRNFLKEGKAEYSGAKIVKVKKISKKA